MVFRTEALFGYCTVRRPLLALRDICDMGRCCLIVLGAVCCLVIGLPGLIKAACCDTITGISTAPAMFRETYVKVRTLECSRHVHRPNGVIMVEVSEERENRERD